MKAFHYKLNKIKIRKNKKLRIFSDPLLMEKELINQKQKYTEN